MSKAPTILLIEALAQWISAAFFAEDRQAHPAQHMEGAGVFTSRQKLPKATRLSAE
jgi:hypothetical protein